MSPCALLELSISYQCEVDCQDIFEEESTKEQALSCLIFQGYHALWNIFNQSNIFKGYLLSGDTKH